MQTGIELIKQFEGCRLHAYVCPAGKLTIGYGHTGPDVYAGQTINQSQADGLLFKDYMRFQTAVEQLVRVPLTDNQLGALVAFTYNAGIHAFATSTMLRLLNGGDYQGAAGQFALWVKGGGKVLPGLVTRRAAEAKLFLAA